MQQNSEVKYVIFKKTFRIRCSFFLALDVINYLDLYFHDWKFFYPMFFFTHREDLKQGTFLTLFRGGGKNAFGHLLR